MSDNERAGLGIQIGAGAVVLSFALAVGSIVYLIQGNAMQESASTGSATPSTTSSVLQNTP